MNILFNINGVANDKITVFYHHFLRYFPVLSNWKTPFCTHPLMAIWIQIYLTAELMNALLKVSKKRSYSTSQYINNRIFDMLLLNILTTHIQCSNIIINCCSRTYIGNFNFKTMCIIKFKFCITKPCYTLQLCFIHAPITICLAGYVKL